MAVKPPPLGSTESLDATIAKFRSNLALYSAACLKIRNKASALVPLDLNTPQTLVQRELTKQLRETGRIRAIVLKARQEGVSTLTAARFFRGIHLWPGKRAMVIADTLQRAGTLYEIYSRFLEHLPSELLPEKRSVARQRYLALMHDSELSVRPSSDKEAGRAMTLHMLHASELAFWGPEARETWVSLMQAVPSHGSEVIVESTAKGAGGLFHELWEAAEQGNAGWLAIFLPWWIYEDYEVEPEPDVLRALSEEPDDFERQALTEGIPFRGELHKLSPRKLAWRRRVIVENFGGDPDRPSADAARAFQQEFPATAEEAFLVSGSCFFDELKLRTMTRKTSDPTIRGWIRPADDGETGLKWRVEKNPRGGVRVWEDPQPDEHYVIGADTAEGKLVVSRTVYSAADQERGDRDYSAAVVLRVGRWLKGDPKQSFGRVWQPPRVVAELHGYIVPEVFTEQLRALGAHYACGGGNEPTVRKNALVGVERNHSSGVTVLRLLREHYHYSPLYWQKRINRRDKREGPQPGWRTDETSRMMMLDTLGELVRKLDIEVPGRDLIREMVTFVVHDDGKPAAEENCHDDRVLALAIAVQMALDHKHAIDRLPPPYDPGDTSTGL